jgi:hypothetical protein
MYKKISFRIIGLYIFTVYATLAIAGILCDMDNEGLEQAKNGKTKPMKESIKSIREKIQ